MARIIYPGNFEKQAELFENMNKKHEDDGADSPLTPFLEEDEIDLAKDVKDTADAQKANDESIRFESESIDFMQERNNLFKPVFSNYRKCVQYLKSFYKKKVKSLKLWGIPLVNTGEIKYPPDFTERAKLVIALYKYHDTLGNKSPLTAFLTKQKIDKDKQVKDTNSAIDFQKKAAAGKKNSEEEMEKRDNLFNPVFAHVKDIGDFLKNLFPDNPKTLGDWGYTVDDSPQAPQQRITEIVPNSRKKITGIKLGSLLNNSGEIPLFFVEGDPVPGIDVETTGLVAGEGIVIKRGMGTLTFFNKDKKESGEITYESNFN